MPSAKICKAIITDENSVRSFAPESPELVGASVNIHPDEDGVQWYWTPESPEDIEAERVASEEAAKAYREANA